MVPFLLAARSLICLHYPERPPGFDLAEAWREAVADVDARRTRVQAVVLASQAAAEGLLHQFGGDARAGTGDRMAGSTCTSAAPRHPSSPSVWRAGATASKWSDPSSSVGGWP
jgi:hypothetical protein